MIQHTLTVKMTTALSKRQSLSTTVLFRPTFTQMIMLNLLMAQQKVAPYIFCGVRINSEKKYQSVD